MSEVAPFVWREDFRIRAYEVGPDERASVLTLCNLFQEAAGGHARAAGVETFDLGGGIGTWVLHRLRIKVADLPRMLEWVSIETWPSGRDGLRAYRDFVVVGEDAREIARGTSAWLVLDVARRRAVRLPDVISGFGPPDRPRALTFDAGVPKELRANAESWVFDVRQSDLDRVGHANNVRFLEWALEALEQGPIDKSGALDLDIRFIAEARFGDRIVSAAEPLGDGAFAHRITRESDGATLAVAASRWGSA